MVLRSGRGAVVGKRKLGREWTCSRFIFKKNPHSFEGVEAVPLEAGQYRSKPEVPGDPRSRLDAASEPPAPPQSLPPSLLPLSPPLRPHLPPSGAVALASRTITRVQGERATLFVLSVSDSVSPVDCPRCCFGMLFHHCHWSVASNPTFDSYDPQQTHTKCIPSHVLAALLLCSQYPYSSAQSSEESLCPLFARSWRPQPTEGHSRALATLLHMRCRVCSCEPCTQP